jgi:hypothetical protein
MSKQLSILIPNRTVETTAGELILKPFKFKDFPVALEIIERYFDLFSRLDSAEAIARAIFDKNEDIFVVMTDISSLIKLVSSFDISESELDYDEVISLLAEIIEMNLDFFNRIGERLTPQPQEEPPKTGESESPD